MFVFTHPYCFICLPFALDPPSRILKPLPQVTYEWAFSFRSFAALLIELIGRNNVGFWDSMQTNAKLDLSLAHWLFFNVPTHSSILIFITCLAVDHSDSELLENSIWVFLEVKPSKCHGVLGWKTPLITDLFHSHCSPDDACYWTNKFPYLFVLRYLCNNIQKWLLYQTENLGCYENVGEYESFTSGSFIENVTMTTSQVFSNLFIWRIHILHTAVSF